MESTARLIAGTNGDLKAIARNEQLEDVKLRSVISQ